MLLNFRLAAEAYARKSPGARSSDASTDPYATVRFFTPEDDDHAVARRVPQPEHVARFYLARPIKAAGLTTRADVSRASMALLDALPRRYRGVDGHRSESADGARREAPILALPDWYRGLYAALNFRPEDPDAFDVERYRAAVVTATTDLLDAEARAAREAQERAEREAAKLARREAARAARGPALTPAERASRARARRAQRDMALVREAPSPTSSRSSRSRPARLSPAKHSSPASPPPSPRTPSTASRPAGSPPSC